MSQCIEQIETIFSKILYRNVESPQTDLFETGLLDSMGLVELLSTWNSSSASSPISAIWISINFVLSKASRT